MKAEINKDFCIACGRCQQYAPNILDYYDNGIVKFIKSNNQTIELTNDEAEEFKKAIRICPTHVLNIEKN